MFNVYKELLLELEELEKFSKAGVLKWIDANAFDRKMRELIISEDDNIDKILRAQFQQRQAKISSIWSNREWYTWWDFLSEWRTFLEKFIWITYKTEQKYFSSQSEIAVEVIEELRELFASATKIIRIYDNYFDKKILKLLWGNQKVIDIQILSSKWLSNLKEDIESFKKLYDDKQVYVRKTHTAHDRFYLIDDTVFSLGTSLQKPELATLFTKLNNEEWRKMISDFNNWWNESDIIID